jgi:2,3-bisphosphoglycerate-independent phosphoglycerate mutase
MKYCVVITDGAAGLPLAERGGKTCLELARTPNLDAMARAGRLGLSRTVPTGMEPSSAVACMSVMGYNPAVYYRGRAAIEAVSMGIAVNEGEVVFRCNLVNVHDGRMRDYSGDHIATPEAAQLIVALNEGLSGDGVEFFPGLSYRHILKLKGREDSLQAVCTPPHDIYDQPVAGYLPAGPGSEILRELMRRSEDILRDHPVNRAREARGDKPITTIWLFWGTGRIPGMPPFRQQYGLKAALSSGVDLLKGLAMMAQVEVLEISGVSDGPDNDYPAQAEGCLRALGSYDLVIAHIEAPDEAGHGGDIEAKVNAIERIDAEFLGRLRHLEDIRVLVQPDHPTPIATRTHSPEPVPFMLWGSGIAAGSAARFTEAEAAKTGLYVENGYNIMSTLTGEA